ncbi:MAG TPA: class I SAM-dependent methyltransferase [Terriglobales bacterium]|nr:class I SAM-dependent methyltransferase [Terriglobales bacterium]
MTEYTLPHELVGEQQRLTLMSALLDPIELAHIDRLGVGAGWRCLELGCGNGSIAQALAKRVAPGGHVVASDIDLRFIAELRAPCLDVRRIDVLRDVMEEGAYDFVVARALLHHLSPAHEALARMVKALKPGGVLLSIEPDMLPCTEAEPESMCSFWQGWLKWANAEGIDYFIGRKIPGWLDSLEMGGIAGEGHRPQFNGGSDWARYWTETMDELAPSLQKSGYVSERILDEFYWRYRDPHYWTSVITFVANWGRKAGRAVPDLRPG